MTQNTITCMVYTDGIIGYKGYIRTKLILRKGDSFRWLRSISTVLLQLKRREKNTCYCLRAEDSQFFFVFIVFFSHFGGFVSFRYFAIVSFRFGFFVVVVVVLFLVQVFIHLGEERQYVKKFLA